MFVLLESFMAFFLLYHSLILFLAMIHSVITFISISNFRYFISAREKNCLIYPISG